MSIGKIDYIDNELVTKGKKNDEIIIIILRCIRLLHLDHHFLQNT